MNHIVKGSSMPNDSLISAIEGLRETYSQRQRATNGLLAALKGTTGALSKANRSLREYADQNANLNRAELAQAQQAFGAARLKDEAIDPLMPDLRREVSADRAGDGAERCPGRAARRGRRCRQAG